MNFYLTICLYNVFKTLKHNILKNDNTYDQKNQIKNYPICENIWIKFHLENFKMVKFTLYYD